MSNSKEINCPMKSLILIAITVFSLSPEASSVQILAKSKLEKCQKLWEADVLNCTSKIILDLAVPSETSGREASMVAEIVEAEENSTNHMRTLRVPPVITINKSATYALYELTYLRDVAYKPQEFFVQTRKCEPDAGEGVVKICERLRDDSGHIIEHTQPTCCPCGQQRRVPSSCGNFFDKLMKGKANTAHCLRFSDEWFHIFAIGQQSVGFSIRVEVKTSSKTSYYFNQDHIFGPPYLVTLEKPKEVIVGPENRTAVSGDQFLRVNLVGDYVGYTNIPSFDDFYLVTPRQGGPGQLQNLGSDFSKWMLLERVRFTLDGLECNKIGVGYEAFNAQPDFCAAPLWSCLHNQLWNFWDADQNRISRNQVPLYCVQGRFQRINQHPVTILNVLDSQELSLVGCLINLKKMQNVGSHAFSIGITEVLNTNLLVELRADDIEYVYQRSPGKILGITVPTFEALTQFGTATITTKNIGELEASYSLTFECSSSVSQMEEQFYIMKPKEITTRSFKLYPTTDQAAKYACAAILKDSEFSEVDRAECQFTTTATVLENGSQTPFQPPKTSISGFFVSIEELWSKLWNGLGDFITGRNCRSKCSGFFDFSCHVQCLSMSWILMFGLFLAIFPTAIVLTWLLHQKGLFDPIYDWWEDHIWRRGHTWKHGRGDGLSHIHLKKNHRHGQWHSKDYTRRRRAAHREHRHNSSIGDSDYHYYLHHVHKDKHKHGRVKNSGISEQVHLSRGEGDRPRHHKRRT